VPPADVHATGMGVEGATDPGVEDRLRQELKGAEAPAPDALPAAPSAPQPDSLAALELAADGSGPAPVPAGQTPNGASAPPASNGGMMEELLAQLKALSEKASEIADANLKESLTAALDAKVTELLAKIEEKAQAKTAREAELEAQVADLAAQVEAAKVAAAATKDEAVAAVEAKLAEAEAKLTEMSVAKDALAATVEQANAEVERLNGELTAAAEALAGYRAAEAKQAQDEKLASRIAELPEAYRAAFGARSAEEQDKARARWSEMTDEQWEAFKADIGFMPTARSYFARSQDEGRLPTGGGSNTGTARERLAQFRDR